MPSIPKSIVVAGLATALALPVLGSDAGAEHTRPAALEGSSVTWCGDAEQIYADPDAYRDSPVYVGNEQPIDPIMEWAQQQPGYEGIWVDPAHLGWITLAFSLDADRRQTDLESEFPGVGVVAVSVEHTHDELSTLQERLARELGDVLPSFAIGEYMPSNVVELDVPYVSPGIVAELEELYSAEPLCVDGADPTDQPLAGPQPTEGDGWQLVGHYQSDGPPWYRTGIATEQTQLEVLWAAAGMPDETPEVDFTDDVVLWFAEPHGSSCSNLRLDDVVVDDARSLVYPLIVMPDAPVACTADLAGSYQYFVALERSRLPEGPFMVQLSPDGPPNNTRGERTVVDIDLSEPGVAAEKSDVHLARD